MDWMSIARLGLRMLLLGAGPLVAASGFMTEAEWAEAVGPIVGAIMTLWGAGWFAIKYRQRKAAGA